MKTIFIALVLLVMCCCNPSAGSVREIVLANPDEVQRIANSGDYSSLLAFINAAYAESVGEGDGLLQQVYLSALANTSEDVQRKLAVDFCLEKADLELKTQGARLLARSYLKSFPSPSTALSARAQAALKVQLSDLKKRDKNSRIFIISAAKALVALGDDSGLDILLSDPLEYRSYSVLDGWDATSSAETFDLLQKKYEQLALSSGRDSYILNEAMYSLCAMRRLNGVEIRKIRPVVDLSDYRER